MPADGAGSCGLGWSPLVSQPWLLESTSGRPLSGIGSCCEHQRGASWLCPEAPSPACPAPPPCPALLWPSAVCLGAGQCQTRGCCCVWSVHSIEGPSLGLGVTPGRGSGCPPGRSEEEPHSLAPGGRAVGKQLPHLLAVALLSPTRRLTRRTCPGGPGPSIAPVKPVCLTQPEAQDTDSVPLVPGHCPLLPSVPKFPSAPDSVGVACQTSESGPGASAPWTQACFCVGCHQAQWAAAATLAWEG